MAQLGPLTSLSPSGINPAYPTIVWNGAAFAVVWNQVATSQDLFGVLLDETGVPIGTEKQLITSNNTDDRYATIVATATGFALMYEEAGGSGRGMQLATFDATLIQTGTSSTIGNLAYAAPHKLAIRPGGYAIAGVTNQLGSSADFMFDLLDTNGARVGVDTFLAVGIAAAQGSVAASQSSFAVAWSEQFGAVHVTVLDSAGGIVRDNVLGPGEDPEVIATPTGWAVAWDDSFQAQVNSSLLFAELSPDGTPIAAPVSIAPRTDTLKSNRSLAGNGSGYGITWHELFPAAETDKDGVYFAYVAKP